MPRKYAPRRPESYKFYSVYNRKTDEPVYIHGTARECAEAMGVKVNTFYNYVHRNKTGKLYCKYEIIVDDKEDEDGGQE